jgi:hypothetical protein
MNKVEKTKFANFLNEFAINTKFNDPNIVPLIEKRERIREAARRSPNLILSVEHEDKSYAVGVQVSNYSTNSFIVPEIDAALNTLKKMETEFNKQFKEKMEIFCRKVLLDVIEFPYDTMVKKILELCARNDIKAINDMFDINGELIIKE